MIKIKATKVGIRAKQGKVWSRMKHLLRSFAVLAALVGCAVVPPPPMRTATPETAPAGFPANLRWDLVPRWIKWDPPTATVSWPKDDGCAGAPVARTLAPGVLLDRFGDEGGTFLSPKGQSFASRAVPYVCDQMDYWVYRVRKPLPVKTCPAAAWFGEPGGAIQDQIAEPVYKLEANGSLTAISYVPGGSKGPFPQCGAP